MYTGKKLGIGGYGKVHEAYLVTNAGFVCLGAIKEKLSRSEVRRLFAHPDFSEDDKKEHEKKIDNAFKNEAEIAKKLIGVNNAAQIIGTTKSGHIIYELYGSRDLKDEFFGRKPFDGETNERLSFDFIALFAYKQIEVLQNAYERGVAFRDIKLDNTLLPRVHEDGAIKYPSRLSPRNEESVLIVADFGAAILMNGEKRKERRIVECERGTPLLEFPTRGYEPWWALDPWTRRPQISDVDWHRADLEQVLLSAALLISSLFVDQYVINGIFGGGGFSRNSEDYLADVCAFSEDKQKYMENNGTKKEDIDKWKDACTVIMNSIYNDYKQNKDKDFDDKAPDYKKFLDEIKKTLLKPDIDPTQELAILETNLPLIFRKTNQAALKENKQTNHSAVVLKENKHQTRTSFLQKKQ